MIKKKFRVYLERAHPAFLTTIVVLVGLLFIYWPLNIRGQVECFVSFHCLFVGYKYKFNLTNLWVEIISGQLLLNFFAQAAQYIHDNLKLDWNKGGGGLVVRRQLPTLVVNYLKKYFVFILLQIQACFSRNSISCGMFYW